MSCCFQILSLPFEGLIVMYLSVNLSGFILIGVTWVSWSWIYISFLRSVNFWSLNLHIRSLPHSLFLDSYNVYVLLNGVPEVPWPLSLSLFSISFCSSDLIISNYHSLRSSFLLVQVCCRSLLVSISVFLSTKISGSFL